MTGGTRLSVADFLFVCNDDDDDNNNAAPFCKLRKAGGGELTYAFNNPN